MEKTENQKTTEKINAHFPLKAHYPTQKTSTGKGIFVIATEGEITEKIYFNKFKEKYKDKIVIYILPTRRDGNSSPKHVVKRIEDFVKRRFSTRRKKDEFWVVIDFDSWGVEQISEAFQKCEKNKFSLAVSNPCFELWLNLHQDNPKIPKTCSDCEAQLTKLLGKKYVKSDYDVDKLIDKLEIAIENSRKLTQDEKELFPKEIGTQVHKLMSKIIK